MDRVSGVYKRWSQCIALVIGLALASVCNIDTIRITRSLWNDPSLRAGVMSAVDQYQRQAAATSGPAAKDYNDRAAEELKKLKIPMGWTDDSRFCAWAVIGWILTAITASFGAPFWFDALQRLANLRGAGPKPKRADANLQQ